MTALTGRSTTSTQPPAHHLVAGALVGAAGVIAFSIAVGSYVVGSSHRLAPSTAAEASVLLAGTPLFVIVGFVHLAVAAGLVPVVASSERWPCWPPVPPHSSPWPAPRCS